LGSYLPFNALCIAIVDEAGNGDNRPESDIPRVSVNFREATSDIRKMTYSSITEIMKQICVILSGSDDMKNNITLRSYQPHRKSGGLPLDMAQFELIAT